MKPRSVTATGILTAALLTAGILNAPAALAGENLFVSPTGSDDNAGWSASAPLATIQHALDLAPSGSKIHLAPGIYPQDVVTVRPGVTIKGPASAVLQGAGGARIVQVHHDDVTLAGFTVDGLVGDPATAAGYRDKLIYVISTVAGDGVDRLKIIGTTLRNAGGECLRLRYLIAHAEVTANTIGPCGVHDFVFNEGGKNGEGIYLGTAPEQQGLNGAPDAAADVSRDNHIHHNVIDTQGNECVDIKENSTANIVEWNLCTGQKDPKSGGFDSRGSGNTFRFNHVHGSVGAGIRLGGDTPTDGVGNDIHSNVITGNGAGGIKFQATPQGLICGNLLSGNVGGDAVGTYAAQFTPGAPCA